MCVCVCEKVREESTGECTEGRTWYISEEGGCEINAVTTTHLLFVHVIECYILVCGSQVSPHLTQ